MSVGKFWDLTVHYLKLGQDIPEYILVKPLVNAGYQAH